MGVPELPKAPDGWLALEAAQVATLCNLVWLFEPTEDLPRRINRLMWSITSRTWDQERAEDVYGVRVARGPA